MIAYYAHSQGFGHSNSAQQFCYAFENKSLIITASTFKFDTNIKVIAIENEDSDYTNYLKTVQNLPRYAHYLPKSQKNILFRNFQILDSCLTHKIAFALVDVSVETAVQFRVAGIPYAYNKMLGHRNDPAHQIAQEASEFLFAYFPKQMEMCTDKAVIEKVNYLGFISRFKFRTTTSPVNLRSKKNIKILMLSGNGGLQLDRHSIEALCKQKLDYHFTIVGLTESIMGLNVNQLPFTNDLEQLMLDNDIVISSCGMNLTSEILSVKNKFIAIAENRPYEEQEMILRGLEKNGLAVKLNLHDLDRSIKEYIDLPVHNQLASYFGSMKNFEKIEKLKPFL